MIDPRASASLAAFDAAFDPAPERQGHLIWNLIDDVRGWWTLTITEVKPKKPRVHLYFVHRVGHEAFVLENHQHGASKYNVLLPRGVCNCTGAGFGRTCKHKLAMVDLWEQGELQRVPVKAFE